MFFRVPKYTHSLIGEQQSLRKYYFIDNGMRQSVLLPQSGDDGKLLENSVFLHLMRKKGAFDKISYYLSGKECDFVVQQHDQVVQLIQVCLVAVLLEQRRVSSAVIIKRLLMLLFTNLICMFQIWNCIRFIALFLNATKPCMRALKI